jgi:FlaA1/EpsC-like NDP-sugar epimerase
MSTTSATLTKLISSAAYQIETDISEIAGYLRGKRVLVTGAGGSIGSELCRQIHRYSPAELMMLDRDESALQAGA